MNRPLARRSKLPGTFRVGHRVQHLCLVSLSECSTLARSPERALFLETSSHGKEEG